MSTDGETSKRLSDALDQIFSRSSGPTTTADDEATARLDAVDRRDGERVRAPVDAPREADVHADPAETYELPEIVPATEEAPGVGVGPTLPARHTRPGAAPTARTPTPEPAPAPAPVAPPAPSPADRSAAAASTSWSDHLTPVPSTAGSAGLRAPGRRPRVRRVTRVLRHVDPWSTFKVALLFSLVTYLVALTSGVLLWRVAESTGTLDNVERWFTQFGWETFELKGGEVFRNAWIIGLFGVVGLTGAIVLLATVFNLVSDIVGGVRLTVLEEEVVERTISSTRRYVVRQGPSATGAAAMPAQDWDVDDAGDGGGASEAASESAPEPGRTGTVESADWSVDDD